MKFFELARCLEPAIPGGLSRAPYFRELISMFTSISEEDWGTRRDPAGLPSDSTLESMYSRDSAFPKRIAQAICSKLNTSQFIERLNDLDLEVQELIAQSIKQHGEEVNLERFAFEVTELLVEILHEKAHLKDSTAAVLRKAKIQAAQAKYRDLLMLRAHGCVRCKAPLAVKSHGISRDSCAIIFLDTDTDLGPEDFAVTCKRCADEFELSHTADEVLQLRNQNLALIAAETIDAELVPLGLNESIKDLLQVINQLPIDEAVPDSNFNVAPLQLKVKETSLLRACRDAMATYETVVRQAAQNLDRSGEYNFLKMRRQIGSAWLAMHNSGMSQYEIWERLSDWIHEHTHVDKYACSIIVAFMIQICDVFTVEEAATV